MSVSEQIMRAIGDLVSQEHKDTFSDVDIREKIGVDVARWESAYAPVLMGMKTDRPASAPDSGAKYRNIFQQLRPGLYALTAYGKDLVEKLNRHPLSGETMELNKVEEPEAMDGLRAWQAATVRLWSATEDAFAELSLTWLPGSMEGAPWTARLHCGDKAEPGWVEDVQIISAASVQQALQRLWDRAKVRHGLFKDTSDMEIKAPTDFPADLWLTTAERALIDRAINTVKRNRADAALRFSYRPDQRLSARWVVWLHPSSVEPPEGAIHEVHAANLMHAVDALLKAMDGAAQQHNQAALSLDVETRALTEQKTDFGMKALKVSPDTDKDDKENG